MNNEYYVETLLPMQQRMILICLILFILMIILTIISVILNIKRKNKKKTIYQILISAITMILPFCIIGYSISLFGINSDLYLGLIILVIGNILTLINIFKK